MVELTPNGGPSNDPQDPQGFSRSGVATIDPFTGEPGWEKRGTQYSLFGSFVRETYGATLFGVDDGEEAWYPGARSRVRLGFKNYVATETESSWSVTDAASGNVLWQSAGQPIHTLTELDGVLLIGGPTESGAEVVAAEPGGYLVALEISSGELVWERTFRDAVVYQPIQLADGDLIVVSADPWIFCD